MSNSSCFSGPAFSLTGDPAFNGQQVEFQLSFDSGADQETVKAYDWYLDGKVIIAQNLPAFNGSIACGTHVIGARILTADGWSGIKTLSFQTCTAVVSLAIIGPDTVNQGAGAAYSVIATFFDGTTQDVTADYVFSCAAGVFSGNIFTASINDDDTQSSTITASKSGADTLNKAISILGSGGGHAGVLVVDLFDNTTLNVIALIDNAEITGHHLAAHTGNNTIPSGAAPDTALILASDMVSGSTLAWRFQFNIAKLLTEYPGSSQYVFYIKGRGNAPDALSGAYGLKTFASQMILGGDPGSYIPGIIGSNLSEPVNYASSVVDGANGSYLEADLTTIIELVYDVAGKSIAISTP